MATGSDSTADDVIRIGVLATLEGVFQTSGEEGVRGVEIALEEFGGEIAGKKIEIIKASTNTQYDVATEMVTKLIKEDQVDFVIGPLSGDEGLAVKAFARNFPHITFINGSSAAQDMTLRNPLPNVFRFSTEGICITSWLAQQPT